MHEIRTIHKFIRDEYRLKFPELESLVDHPTLYAHVVNMIGNETDSSLVGLEEVLPSRITMPVILMGSTSIGKPHPKNVLRKTFEACDRAIELDLARKKESRMAYVAPNLSAIVGNSVAAKLVEAVGGLIALANIPVCDIMLLGDKKSNNNLEGFSFLSQSRVGYIEQTKIFKSTPPRLITFASHHFAAKSALAIQVDLARGDLTGKIRRRLCEEILIKIEKR